MHKSFLQIYPAFTAFFLSGTFIFNPLYKSQSPIISLITSILTSLVILSLYLLIFKRLKAHGKSKTSTIFAIFELLLSICICLMMITEIIKDTSFIANKGISFSYYFFICLCILTVSFYLCVNSHKGIFRFSIPCVLPFLILFILIPFCLFSTKNIVNPIKDLLSDTSIIYSITNGIKAGFLFTVDIPLFLFCFSDYVNKCGTKTLKKSLYLGLLSSFLLILSFTLFMLLIFGKNLLTSLSRPDYALIKLFPGIDVTEILTLIKIVSFLIKSSVYFHSVSVIFSLRFNSPKKACLITKSILYISIPIFIILLYSSDNTLGYGAFQHLFLPALSAFSIFFIILSNFFRQSS